MDCLISLLLGGSLASVAVGFWISAREGMTPATKVLAAVRPCGGPGAPFPSPPRPLCASRHLPMFVGATG